MMLRRIEAEQKAEAAEEHRAPIEAIERHQPSDLERAPKLIYRQTRSRARWLALEKAAGP